MASEPFSYTAWWTDAFLAYHPQYFGTVAPGDSVSGTLTEIPTSWNLRFVDRAQSIDEQTSVRYGRGGTFVYAEWIEESPTASPPSRDPRFPRCRAQRSATFASMAVPLARHR